MPLFFTHANEMWNRELKIDMFYFAFINYYILALKYWPPLPENRSLTSQNYLNN